MKDSPGAVDFILISPQQKKVGPFRWNKMAKSLEKYESM